MGNKVKHLILASSFILSGLTGCSSNSEQPNTELLTVTFHHSTDAERNVSLDVVKGQSVYTALNGDLSSLEDLCKTDGMHFDNWFVSEEAAQTLNYGENNQNLFKYDTIIESSLNLYPGFSLDGFDNKLNDFIGEYLGAYQKAKNSPIPFLRTNAFHKDDSAKNVFYFDNVSLSKFNAYKEDLVEKYGFSLIDENVYLDKLSAYTINLAYLEGESSVKVTMNFNDKVGEFPSKFFASNFPGLDMSYYLKSESFALAENTKGEDLTKKFIIVSKENVLVGGGLKKSIFYMPKADDEAPLESLATWFESSGALQLASSTSPTYIDMFGNTLVSISLVNKVGAETYKKEGVKEGMVSITFNELYTKENNFQDVQDYFAKLTGVKLPENLFFNIEGAQAYGTLLGYTMSGSLPAVGQHIVGVSKTSFDAWLKKEEDAGMIITSSASQDYLTKFVGKSSTGEFMFQASFYDESLLGDLSQNVVQLLIYRNQSIYEKIEKWFALNNVGGGNITSLPELDGSNLSSGYLSNGTSTIYYGYYLRGLGVNKEAFTKYQDALIKTNEWVDVTKADDEYPNYLSKDGFYLLALVYDENTSSLIVQIIYNGFIDVKSLDDAIEFVSPRIGAQALDIPGLRELYENESVKPAISAAQYYNNTDQRAHFVVTLDSQEKVNTYFDTIIAKASEDSSYEYIGTNSNNIKFFEHKEDGFVFYVSDVSDVESETPTYELLVGMYRLI